MIRRAPGKEWNWPPDRPVPDPPTLSVTLDTPSSGSTCKGGQNGVTVQVAGRWSGSGYVGTPALSLSLDNSVPVAVAATPSTWSATVAITSAVPK